MRKTLFILIFSSFHLWMIAGLVEKSYVFSKYEVHTLHGYHEIVFPGTRQSALPGKPSLPWQTISLLIPYNEIVTSIEILRQHPSEIPGQIFLKPGQPVLPLNTTDSVHVLPDPEIYNLDIPYPDIHDQFNVQYLHGFGFIFASFSPINWIPSLKKAQFYREIVVRIHTRPALPGESLPALHPVSGTMKKVIRELAENPEQIASYPGQKTLTDAFQYLIITPSAFKNEFQPLVSLCALKGMDVRVVTVDSIQSVSSGYDKPEKIRNFIVAQYNQSQIQYVLLAGNPSLVPCRYLHCSVISGGTYYDSIPSDLYYAGMNGNFDLNANHKYGEIADSADLLPELSVGRFPVNDTAELRKMIRKTISYQINPVQGEFSKPLLLGEYLYANPLTFGSTYMNLLVNDHTDNGYFTHGIPSAANQIMTLYDSLISPPLNLWQWTSGQLLTRINQGNTFIHHVGHASSSLMLKLSISSIVNSNFPQVNGVTHNYQLLYTQGCDDGAFDKNCIAAKAVKIDNFLVAGIFNSRYGWFNQGTSDGPSEHLQREFTSALYHDTLPEIHIGTAHSISKIKTAPFVGLPGEFEPGAQRWCHFDCNLLGDPALTVWTEEPPVSYELTWTGAISSDWHNPANWSPALVPGSICNVTIPLTPHQPAINSAGTFFCRNLTIGADANLTINPGMSLIVYGTIIMSTD